jgi:membrane protease YdiL (CAAX protease family)
VYSATRGWHALTGRPHPPEIHYLGSAVVLAILPVLAARWLTGRGLADLGLGLGHWREGLVWLAVGLPLAIAAGWVGAASAGQRAVYPLDPTIVPSLADFAPYAALQFLYYGSWEVLFRAVLLFGLRDPLGAGPANAVQTGVSVTAHFGRSLDETFPSFPAGLVFGWLSLRLRTVWVVALIHWTTGVSQDWFILHR